ncbi:beta-1,3-glucan-binding protein-like [Sitodiplosis mosellana]|uniref:beta-1,3-glucan-binding protein-like n=1 Tax=Sitodiplosis mosellana TaxID=263140 RepID=UPI0024443838|nr:beta-1,3-glucan-binding protein-like [Sitodiplosis mosellana]
MLKVTFVVILNTLLVLSVIFIVLMFLYQTFIKPNNCKPSITTANGFAAERDICSGGLIFEENFDKLDKLVWRSDVTLGGGGNGEFQWYVDDTENAFVKNGKLHIKPTLTANRIGYDQVEQGYVHLIHCTDHNKANCERQAGTSNNIIINPVRSARLSTKNSFAFKYGRVEVVAKIPTGQWLWPAIRLLPSQSKYGGWPYGPRSGEIDLIESRGNADYADANGVHIGVKRITSTLRFGPRSNVDNWCTVTFAKHNRKGFDRSYHIYEFLWNEEGIRFFVDRVEIGFVPVAGGFWNRGDFQGNDIWASGTKMAPFDEEFYLVMNVAVGGTNGYFPDNNNTIYKKPWNNTSSSAMKDFWTHRDSWISNWHLENDDSSLLVDSIRVWAA